MDCKVNNSHLELKLNLRLRHLPAKRNLFVLDCFGGDGIIWQEVQKRVPKKKITSLRIDMKPDYKGIYLHGDNRKYLRNMDLSIYDIIDIDAYGLPSRQLDILKNNKTLKKETIIFFTFIQVSLGSLGYAVLDKLGYSRRMIAKCPTLFSKNSFVKFTRYLSVIGITEISYLSVGRKVYGVIKERSWQ